MAQVVSTSPTPLAVHQSTSSSLICSTERLRARIGLDGRFALGPPL